MPREQRQIKRPRLSLSCVVCRRRKVRCGREHPKCANCVRMREECVYESTVRDDYTGQVREADNAIDPSEEPAAGSRARSTRHREASASAKASPARSRRKIDIEEASVVHREVESGTVWREPICSDHLSLRRGARARYIGQAFWGFVAGKESLSDDFFDDNRNADPELPPSHISPIDIFSVLQSMPNKAVSDALLDVFFFAVWPLSPLVHCPTLRADYDEFWVWCQNVYTAAPPAKSRKDPTFICLLFAVLYCGACAAPAASWTCDGLQGHRKETIVDQLKSAYTTSLSLCQHLEHPTLNSLVSTLLAEPFLDRPREPMRELVSVSTTVRLAQSMGLHREGPWCSALSPVDREIRRRAWWRIVRLDVQSSISTGLPPCCASEALGAVSMMADARDEDIDDLPPSPAVVSGQSIAMMFAIGCSDIARLQSRIVAHIQSGRDPTHDGFGELVTSAKKLQQKIDALIARIPSQGIPEKGFIPSRLANASPSTHPLLYRDDTTQPTVFAAWTRIMLTLLRSDVAILLQKPFLPPPDSSNPESCKAWTSMLQLCVGYFRILLQVYQTPAFSPYMWFFSSYNGPLQCIFLTLIYLHSFKDSRELPLARYCVDEIMEHYQSARAESERTPLAMQALVDLHSRLDSHAGLAKDSWPSSLGLESSDIVADPDLSSLLPLIT